MTLIPLLNFFRGRQGSEETKTIPRQNIDEKDKMLEEKEAEVSRSGGEYKFSRAY